MDFIIIHYDVYPTKLKQLQLFILAKEGNENQ